MPEKAELPVVLITGSSGFLGQAITNGLEERYRVIGFDLPNARRPSAGTELIPIDITSDESVRRAVEKAGERSGGRIASVVHLAAYYDTSLENPVRLALASAQMQPGSQLVDQ